MAIKYVKNTDIDKQKWDNCIKNACQPLMYGFSWYLDTMADNWDALVLDNYNAVMPLPWKQKYGIKYIYQPFFIQQLGVFAPQSLHSNEIISSFLDAIPLKFFKITTNLQVSNVPFVIEKIKLRKNYILSLHQSYEDISNKYAKDLKNTIRKSKSVILLDLTIKEVLEFYINIYAKRHSNIKNSDYLKLENLILKLKPIANVEIIGIKENNNLLAFDVMTFFENKLYYQLCGANKDGKKIDAHYIIIDSLIKKYQNQPIVLDFEGSEIESIAYFFKKFGATPEHYGVYQTNIFKRILHYFKK